ncbi:SDR family oxidoreductase [Aquamicrobium sp. LC103]|uniref:SDR family oxidoreductase n=1 Tax=Aquamicrobium sp. LC103 TaxID=1120658 RepID=UPI00063EA924|nr:SDR family oxidoreductase [Aquamicrobium sp. LC103]TKT69114.1 SDR family oxidoreductase [Aquamicrobium sp. LC103]
MTMRVFLFGAGYSARAFARLAVAEGAHVAGTTRSQEKAPLLEAEGIAPFLFDGSGISAGIAAELREATHLVVSTAPDEAGDPVLRTAGAAIANMPRLRWIGYLSTVGVYGDHQGRWVDETSDCRPVSRRSKSRLEADEAWLRLGEATGKPVAILRLSGIYGPGRNAFVNLENGTARRIVKPGQVFNRIHVEDIAGALRHLAGAELGGIFNVTDDEPAPPQDVVALAAALMGVEPPPEVDFDQAEMTPMARSFYGESKRVSNARLKASGYAFRFPDHRAALRHMWEAGDWRGRQDGPAPDRRSKIRR